MEFKEYSIEDCCQILNKLRLPMNSEERFDMKGDYPYYGANGVQDYINRWRFDDDLILIAEDGGNFEQFAFRPIAYRVSGKCWVNNHAHVLKAKEGFSQSFIFYSLQHKNILFFIAGGTRSKLTQGELRKILIPHPEKTEADRIGAIIEKSNQAIEQTEKLIAKYQSIKIGLMQDLLTKGIDEKGNIRNEKTHRFKTESGLRVPVEWEVKTLNEVSTITRLAGYEYSTVWKVVEDGEIISLRGFNIGDNKIIEKDFDRISTQLSKRLKRSKLYIDDIVFPCVGTIGNAVVIKENDKYHINQNIAKITPRKTILSDFVVYYLMSEQCKNEIAKFNATSSQPNVLVGSLRKFLISFPKDAREQKIIIESIMANNRVLDNETRRLNKLQSLKTGLMQDLLSGKVRVKIKQNEMA